MECEGVHEILENMLNHFGRPSRHFSTNPELQSNADIFRTNLLQYVLLTGGNSLIQGFDNRVKAELRMLNHPEMNINVVNSYDAMLDAWKGGALLAQERFKGSSLRDYSISKA